MFENLRDPESLHQLLDSLEALDRVAEEVFGRIIKRVDQQKTELQGIQTRIAAAEVRAVCLSPPSPHALCSLCSLASLPSSRAVSPSPFRISLRLLHAARRQGDIAAVAARKGEGTTVFSPSKYPAPAQLADYTAVNMGGQDVRVLKRATFSLPPISAEEEEKERSTVEDSSLFEYSANAAPSTTVNTALEGLGKVPAHLVSASSLLLFNSTQNPYKKYSALDTMQGDAGKEEEKEDEGPSADAPKSVVTGEAYEGLGSSDISYQPGKAPLAQFNLAPTLNLPGAPVANNIAFSESVSQVRTPSSQPQSLCQSTGCITHGRVALVLARLTCAVVLFMCIDCSVRDDAGQPGSAHATRYCVSPGTRDRVNVGTPAPTTWRSCCTASAAATGSGCSTAAAPTATSCSDERSGTSTAAAAAACFWRRWCRRRRRRRRHSCRIIGCNQEP